MNEILMALGGLIGLVLLYYGAEYLVRGGSAIASRSCVSPLVIGLTLVAFGTSAPELFVSTSAALHGLGDICIGNVVGSNICNIALILGLSALISPLAVNAELFKHDLPIMILASMVLTVVCLFCGGIGRVVGLLFVVGIVAYTIVGIKAPGKCEGETSSPQEDISRGMAWFAVIGGLLALVGGAKLILLGAVAIEKHFGVADEFVALTVVAIGTSLPELATSVVAARKGEADIAIGNVVGSNIFNILGILGVSALLRPVAIEGMDWVDFGMMLVTAVGLWPLMGARGRLVRFEGILLLMVYGIYIWWLVHTM
ncbi:MAG: calcium/sodium antiporter [bacterium]|nr:calcium/sodium antiporter [Candidatus Colisoma equi]